MGLYTIERFTLLEEGALLAKMINLIENTRYKKHPAWLNHAGCFLVFVFHNVRN